MLERMHRHAETGHSLVMSTLGLPGQPGAWAHFPAEDALDADCGYRWFYHAHAPDPRRDAREHGHFHLFADFGDEATRVHLAAIAVDAGGLPLRMEAPNRWVTDDCWRPACEVIELARDFRLRQPHELKPLHDWLRELLIAFEPQLRQLLRHRDRRVQQLRRSAGSAVLDDRRVTTLSRIPLDIHQQAAWLDHAA